MLYVILWNKNELKHVMQHTEMGDLADVSFLQYKLKHLETNKENNRNFWSFSNCKILMP